MLSTYFSCASWPSVCLLWEKYLFRSSAHFLIVYFWYRAAWAVWKIWRLIPRRAHPKQILLPFYGLSFSFVCGFLCCAKAFDELGPTETDMFKWWGRVPPLPRGQRTPEDGTAMVQNFQPASRNCLRSLQHILWIASAAKKIFYTPDFQRLKVRWNQVEWFDWEAWPGTWSDLRMT